MATESTMTNTRIPAHGRVLHSWKEIATYMGRGIRTIQRYEARLGLPVRRPSGAPRSAVLAFSHEIDEWLAKSPTRIESVSNVRSLGDMAFDERRLAIQAIHRRALLGQQRVDAMQKRLETMQTLVSQLTVRMQAGVERRKQMRTGSNAREEMFGTLTTKLGSWLMPGRAKSEAFQQEISK